MLLSSVELFPNLSHKPDYAKTPKTHRFTSLVNVKYRDNSVLTRYWSYFCIRIGVELGYTCLLMTSQFWKG